LAAVQLSVRQRQRLALAPALAIVPRVLLLNEPFGALDADARKELPRWLRKSHKRRALTTVFVMHDHDEVMDLADRVIVLNQGQVEQVGASEELTTIPPRSSSLPSSATTTLCSSTEKTVT
jgi:sulfate transport system ATP-binding protein